MNRQQPGPKGVGIVVSLMHWPSGLSPIFWLAFGGITYGSVWISWLVRLSAGVALSSDAVLVSVHIPMVLLEPLPLASAAALELRKYSVEPWVSAGVPPGAIEGQT